MDRAPVSRGRRRVFGLLLAFFLPSGALAQQKVVDIRSLVDVREGSLPIVMSVPHGGSAEIPGVLRRTGEGAASFVTMRDVATIELAETAAARLEKRLGGRPFMIVARFDRKYIDANRRPEDAWESEIAKPVYDAYYAAISNACQVVRARWGRGLLLDIHGQSSEPDAIYRGTVNRLAVTNLIQRSGAAAVAGPGSIHGRMAEKGYAVLPVIGDPGARETRYTGGFIIRAFGSHNPGGLDAIMVEFGRNFRARDRLAKTAADFADAVADFAADYLPPARPPRAVGPARPRR